MAYLAALPKAPSNYHPQRKTKAAIERRNWVLRQMQENGYITPAEAAEAQAQPLGIRAASGFDETSAPYFTEEIRRLLIERYGSDTLYEGGLSVRSTLDPTLQEKAQRALREGLEALDRRQGWRGALGRLDQAVDLDAQLAEYTKALPDLRYAALVTDVHDDRAEIYVNGQIATIPFELAKWAYPPRRPDGVRPPPLASLKEALAIDDIIIVQPPDEAKDLLKEGYEPKTGEFALGQRPAVEGAIVALDPHTGRMLALVGGYDYRVSEFNRATQARRQPGSAFKPFVYLAALDKGYSPTTLILDAPLALDQGQGKPKWKPANYTRKFYGPSIMRVGIEKSRNLMTARLAMAIGMPAVQEYAAKFGIDAEMPPYLSMSLGAGETTLLKLTAAYGQIVNGGRKIEVSLIDRVQDRYGRTLMRHDGRDCSACLAREGWQGQKIPELPISGEQLTSPASAYQMVSMLEGVITRGTGRRIADSGLVLAGKTGTTNDNTNAMFIGFSPDLVVGVYVGYDIPRPLGKSETGSTAAVPIFKDFMMDALANAPIIPFRRPGGISLVPVHAETGERVRHDDKMAVLEAFKPGQRPKSGILIDLPDASPASGVDAPALY